MLAWTSCFHSKQIRLFQAFHATADLIHSVLVALPEQGDILNMLAYSTDVLI